MQCLSVIPFSVDFLCSFNILMFIIKYEARTFQSWFFFTYWVEVMGGLQTMKFSDWNIIDNYSRPLTLILITNCYWLWYCLLLYDVCGCRGEVIATTEHKEAIVYADIGEGCVSCVVAVVATFVSTAVGAFSLMSGSRCGADNVLFSTNCVAFAVLAHHIHIQMSQLFLHSKSGYCLL